MCAVKAHGSRGPSFAGLLVAPRIPVSQSIRPADEGGMKRIGADTPLHCFVKEPTWAPSVLSTSQSVLS